MFQVTYPMKELAFELRFSPRPQCFSTRKCQFTARHVLRELKSVTRLAFRSAEDAMGQENR